MVPEAYFAGRGAVTGAAGVVPKMGSFTQYVIWQYF